MRDPTDRSSQWLITHHGNSVLWLGGARDIVSWSAVKSELVQPKQLPDGLIEAEVRGHKDPVLFLVEIATYPEKRVLEQMRANALHVVLAKGTLPEMLVVVLRPKGQYRVPTQGRWTSPLGSSRLSLKWNVIELWNQPAAQLLAANDVGLIPWVPLTQFNESTASILDTCRGRIDRGATGERHQNFLAVMQFMVKLRFPDPALLEIFGGQRAMIESPLYAELEAQVRHKDIKIALAERLGTLPPDVSEQLKPITNLSRLDEVFRAALTCATYDQFRTHLSARPKRKRKK